MLSGFLLILAIIFIKYKPVYELALTGEKLGYIENISDFKKAIEEIINQEGTNIAYVQLKEEPKYEFKLVTRETEVSDDELIEKINLEDTQIVYKYYEIALNNETKTYVDTLDTAENVVNEIKEDYDGDIADLDIQINEIYTENLDTVNDDSLKVESKVVEVAENLIEESQAIAIVNDIKFAYLPVSGRITSRYGEKSSIRSSSHTGLDIACITGTPIKAVAGGTVTFSGRSGSYGNIIKIDHGNGVETWYGHCSKLYAEEGKQISSGEIIAAVGSTGNSTGPHLHFEIRINGVAYNPQNYMYK